MQKLKQSKTKLHEITLALERYSRYIFKELLRLQKLAQPPRSSREVYRFINPSTFQQFTKLPKLVSDALFGCFSQKQKCDSIMFYTGLEMLLHDTLEGKSSFVTFAMLDSDKDSFITKADCKLMLNSSVAHPSLIEHVQTSKLKRKNKAAIRVLFGKQEMVSKEDYMTLAFQGQNSVHSLIWEFMQEHFNVMEQVHNLKLFKFSSSEKLKHLSETKTQDSFRKGYLLCEEEEEEKKLIKKFFRLVNRELIEFKSDQDEEYCSLKYLGFEAFLEQTGIKEGPYFKFMLKSGAETCTFCTESIQEHDYWVQGIKRVIGKHIYRNVNEVYRFKSAMKHNLSRAQSLVDGSQVIIKTLQKCTLDFEGYKQVREEIEILQMCSKPEIITTLIDYFEDSETFHLVFKPTTELTLKEYFLKEKKSINPDAVRALTKQLSTAVFYLSKYNILHRNINPSSVFLTDKTFTIVDKSGREIRVPQIQLGDFSCSTILQNQQELSKVCGLASFAAPEAIKFKSYGYSADMYSLGATIYFLMTGQAPYFDKDIKELYKKILHKKPELSVQFILNSPGDLVQFVSSLVVKNPNHRLSIQEVMLCLKGQHRSVGISKIFRRTSSVPQLRQK